MAGGLRLCEKRLLSTRQGGQTTEEPNFHGSHLCAYVSSSPVSSVRDCDLDREAKLTLSSLCCFEPWCLSKQRRSKLVQQSYSLQVRKRKPKGVPLSHTATPKVPKLGNNNNQLAKIVTASFKIGLWQRGGLESGWETHVLNASPSATAAHLSLSRC